MAINDYTGAGGGFRRSLDAIDEAVYKARTQDRVKEERVTRNRLRSKIAREEEAKRLARAEERDQQNRERMKQIKAGEKQRCINAGMTASDFEQVYWPKRKIEIIEESIKAHAVAQAADSMYNNCM